MLIHSASQLLTISGSPQRGSAMGELGILPDGAVLTRAGKIAEIGPTREMLSRYPREEKLDARGRVVMPGFVDPHTHLIFAGDRAGEFEQRLQGKTYLEILAAGGGILSTVNATRAASREQLTASLRQRARQILRMGTTTAEVKTGYGLETTSEIAQLMTVAEYADALSPDLVPTFLPAHAVPPEFKDNPAGYVRQITDEMLPRVKSLWSERFPARPLPFVDVFCERGAFSLAESRLILTRAAELGFPLKIHADEFENLGGASLAAELGAASADHLVCTSPADIQNLAKSQTVAVSLPCTPFGLGETAYTPARDILKADGLLALASDFNPGTAWSGNMQFVLALACRYLKLTPAQAVVAATINAAAAVQQADRIGSLEPGKLAHLLILDTDDYRQLGYRFGANLVACVIKDEKVIHNTEDTAC
jgi:imidazolonepropionase